MTRKGSEVSPNLGPPSYRFIIMLENTRKAALQHKGQALHHNRMVDNVSKVIMHKVAKLHLVLVAQSPPPACGTS